LVLVPTRELARQLVKQFTELAEFTQIEVGTIIGGDDFQYQASMLRKNPEVLVATPGRLLEHLDRHTAELGDLEVLILDEADRMLDLGFSEDVLTITSQCNKERQTMLFSATLDHVGVRRIADETLKDPQKISLNTAKDKHTNITQQKMLSDDRAHKQNQLLWLLANETYAKCIVFVNTREYSDLLGNLLRSHHLKVGVLHGNMDQPARNAIMDLLRKGKINVLVATDVAARGLDVKGVDLVVNFEMARNADDYVHRIGRTGRAGEQGLAISLISHSEWSLMSSIERYLKVIFPVRKIKGQEGVYKGPKKLKSNGKAAGSKKKKMDKKLSGKKPPKKPKKPKSNRPARPATERTDDGMAPFKKK
jgi:superfamily II DNA/RNA helicase